LSEPIHWDAASISLLAVNLITIFVAVQQNWDPIVLIWVYWSQCAIMAFFAVLKILAAKDLEVRGFGLLPALASKNKAAGAFATFAILAVFLYGIAGVLRIIDLPPGVHVQSYIALPEGYSREAAFAAALPLAGLFFINHLFSFIFYKMKQPQTQSYDRLFVPIMARICFISLLMFPINFFRGQTLGLVFFLLLKTFIDLQLHAKEHAGEEQPEATV
jgi:hypothetical protein